MNLAEVLPRDRCTVDLVDVVIFPARQVLAELIIPCFRILQGGAASPQTICSLDSGLGIRVFCTKHVLFNFSLASLQASQRGFHLRIHRGTLEKDANSILVYIFLSFVIDI